MAEALAEDTRAEADATPAKAHRRWQLEIKLAQKREKDWREKAKKTLDVYRGKDRKKNSFNILWSNTEVMRPALYNSPPKPDVRRRFRQNDPLGKAVSEVMERGVSYCVDAYDLDNCLQNDVLDALLPGRGLSRVRYVPKFKQIPEAAQELPAGGPRPPPVGVPAKQPAAAEGPDEGDREELEYEQALGEHVQWDDFLHGVGKTWEEVEWNAFRHTLCRDDLIDKFGEEIGKEITLDDTSDEELNNDKNSDLKGVFKRAVLWEIWDKQGKKVFFLNDSYKKGLLYAKDAPNGEPPLKLKNFFPVPRPLQLMEDTGNLVPEPLYEQYREQAEELNRLSTRKNKIIQACRVRFVFDSTLSELKALMDANDNVGIPAESARAWMTNGGIEKAIWWMPIEQIAAVLVQIDLAIATSKQIIYEITGLSDILRGATDPNETLGAQQLKANSTSLRLQRMKTEVQRYARDLIKLLAEVIGENFDVSTLAQMTGLKFPTAQQKQMIQLQMQAAQQMMAQPGAQPPPEVQQKMAEGQKIMAMPSWEDIQSVMKNDMQREFRVDVETDSTVAQSLQQDMEGIREVFTGLVELWTGAGPAVMSGAVSIEVVKAMSLNIARRARMGLEVEDAIETGMQQPKPAADPNAAKAEEAKVQAQADQAKEAEITKREQATAQAEAAQKQQDTAADLQREQLASQEKVQLDAQQKAHDLEVRRMELEKEDAFKRWEVEQNNEAKVEVAEIAADAAAEREERKAEEGAEGAPTGGAKKRERVKKPRTIDKMADMHNEAMGLHGETLKAIAKLAENAVKPKRLIRNSETGRAEGVETVQ